MEYVVKGRMTIKWQISSLPDRDGHKAGKEDGEKPGVAIIHR